MNNDTMNYTVDNDGYVNGYALIGELQNSFKIAVKDFDFDNFQFYKRINEELVWDGEKHQRSLNPVPKEPQLSEFEILTNYMLDVDMRLLMIEMSLI